MATTSLKIESVTRSRDSREECVRLEVLADINLAGFALVVEKGEPGIDDTSADFFRFPEWQVKKGDFVRVFSGKGVPHSTDNLLQTKTHFFYWNKSVSLWEGGSGKVELIQITESSGKIRTMED